VAAAGGEVHPPALECHAVDRFHDADGGQFVEPPGERRGEDRRHVLHDRDRHPHAGIQQGNDPTQHVGPAGRGADGDRVEAGSDWEDGAGLRRLGRCGVPPREAGDRGGELAEKVLAGQVGVEARRLEDVMKGPLEERFDGGRGSICGQAADHDHPGLQARAAKRPQHADAVHAWHGDVEGDQVGPELMGLSQRLFTIRGRANHLDPPDPLEDVPHHLPVQGGVVDDQRGERRGHGIPRSLGIRTTVRNGRGELDREHGTGGFSGRAI